MVESSSTNRARTSFAVSPVGNNKAEAAPRKPVKLPKTRIVLFTVTNSERARLFVDHKTNTSAIGGHRWKHRKKLRPACSPKDGSVTSGHASSGLKTWGPRQRRSCSMFGRIMHEKTVRITPRLARIASLCPPSPRPTIPWGGPVRFYALRVAKALEKPPAGSRRSGPRRGNTSLLPLRPVGSIKQRHGPGILRSCNRQTAARQLLIRSPPDRRIRSLSPAARILNYAFRLKCRRRGAKERARHFVPLGWRLMGRRDCA